MKFYIATVIAAVLACWLGTVSAAPTFGPAGRIFEFEQEGLGPFGAPFIEGDETANAFYDYRSDSAHTDFEGARQSILFYYHDTTNDALSLILVHGVDDLGQDAAMQQPAGSAVELDFIDLPAGVAVSLSDEANEMQLGRDPEGSWTFGGNSDGAVLGGIPQDADFEFQIVPNMNAEVNDWHYVYPGGVPLALDRTMPLTLRSIMRAQFPAEADTVEGELVEYCGYIDDPNAVLTVTVDWGDGEMTILDPAPAPSEEFCIQHTYADDGDFEVVISAANADAEMAQTSIALTVANAEPELEPGGPYMVEEGAEIILEVQVNDRGAADTHQARWDFDGDGTWDTELADELSVTTQYADDGEVTALVEVCDDDGACTQVAIQITVANVSPTITSEAPATVNIGSDYVYTVEATDPGDDTISYALVDAPMGMMIDDDGILTWTPGPDDGGEVSFTVVVTDEDGGETTQEVTINVIPDQDGDGILDDDDNCPLDANAGQENHDGDPLGDVCDPDADNDGLTSAAEEAAGTNPLDGDSDDDGVLDSAEPDWDQDTDGDGLINALDPDSDNDGILDGTEFGLVLANITADTAPAVGNFRPDVDPMTTTDLLNADTDGGGVPDGVEDANHDGAIDVGEGDPNDPEDDDPEGDPDEDGIPTSDDNCPLQSNPDQGNHDGDSLGDVCDSDADNDGLSNAAETAAGTDPLDADSDDDGVLDSAEPDWNQDTDDDGAINALDPDSDNDGVLDGTEMGIVLADLTPDTAAAVGNFRPDMDPDTTTDPLNGDTDMGGVPDGAEDANRNGLLDDGEGDPNDPDDDDPAGDPDMDEVPNATDNCPNEANPDQADHDGDQLGDICDSDLDGDGALNVDEIAAGTDPADADTDDDGVLDGREPDWDQDTDEDGLINALDPDSDGDDLLDGTEAGLVLADISPDTAPAVGNFRPDADPDTTTDPIIADTDGGGVVDGVEDQNQNGAIDDGEGDPNDPEDDNPNGDPDGDGVPTIEDNCPLEPNFRQTDTDRDGRGDACDNDTDGDGVLNHIENAAGTDPMDPDSDDDGVIDGLEPDWDQDTDGDGQINALDPDSDNDGLLDGTELGVTERAEGTDPHTLNFVPDADPDTTTDPLNADTDGGGIPDGIEDLNRNGAIDPDETDPNEPLDDMPNADSDEDGLLTSMDNCPNTANPEQADHDQDGLGDACDFDIDNDGISNEVEEAAGTDPADADSDDDGLLDGLEFDWDQDTDEDGDINALDPDSDDDGLLDGTESGLVRADLHPDTAGAVGNFRPDADPETTTDPLNPDTDGGGTSDGTEDTNQDGAQDEDESDPNVAGDDDPDADGLTNDVEIAAGTNPNDPDTDDDGVPDGAEPDWDQDTDEDGLVNAADPDSDNDGLLDGTELGLSGPPPEGTDPAANNYEPDADPETTTDPLRADTDNGTVPDGIEDANHNGRVDEGETDPNVREDDMASDDLDNDGVLNDDDNCPVDANPDQADLDGDMFGDACDDDLDGDGLANANESAAGTNPIDADSDDDGVIDGDEPNWDQDTDEDGLINALDPDSDNDGILDGTEMGITDSALSTDTDLEAGNFVPDADPTTITDPLQVDTDSGGVPDGLEDTNHNGRIDDGETDPSDPDDDDVEADRDGDGIADLTDNCLEIANPDQDDLDEDGEGDACDSDIDDDGIDNDSEIEAGTDPADNDSDDDGVADGDEPDWDQDTDGDGLINALDSDSDDDGILDGTELGVTDDSLPVGTDTGAGNFVADADPSTTTDPLLDDTDGGGIPDGLEDPNADGAVDPGESDPNNASDDDTDDDGVPNHMDNCPDVANPDQMDSDDNGIGDACENTDMGMADGGFGTLSGSNPSDGCSQGDGADPLWLLLLLGLPLTLRRRRD